MKKVISVRFKENGKSYYFDPGDAVIHAGEYVIVETARGVECGEVVQGVLELADAAVPKALKPITRMADSVDIRRMRQNREDEKRAYHTCQECIARHGLEMKLLTGVVGALFVLAVLAHPADIHAVSHAGDRLQRLGHGCIGQLPAP